MIEDEDIEAKYELEAAAKAFLLSFSICLCKLFNNSLEKVITRFD